MNDLITLPKIIFGNSEMPNRSFFIHKHQSNKQVLKNKILLQYNLISFLLTGEKILQYANKTTLINDNQIAILSSGNCLMTEKLSVEKNYCSTLFFFDDKSLTDFFIKYKTIIDKAQAEELNEPFVVLEKDHFIKHFIVSLEFVLQKSNPSQEILQLKFEEFMLYLLEKHPYVLFSFQKNNQDENVDFQIREAVEKNITNNISLTELAFLCNTSISTFKRKFVKLYNVPPSQYFLQKKMEVASLLLLNRELPSEVSYKIGYENPSSFSQSFKQVFGISPKQYQQQNLVD